MSEKHTPGPWTFDGPHHSIIVWGPEPELRVCFMTSDGPAEANARLIAAAPELLEALVNLVNLDQRCGWHSKQQDAALAVIAKATGAPS